MPTRKCPKDGEMRNNADCEESECIYWNWTLKSCEYKDVEK